MQSKHSKNIRNKFKSHVKYILTLAKLLFKATFLSEKLTYWLEKDFIFKQLNTHNKNTSIDNRTMPVMTLKRNILLQIINSS